MAEGRAEVEVGAGPDEVWAVAGDFAGIGEYLPGIDSFRTEGDDRVIGMFGMEIRERLVARDGDARTFTYSVVDGVPVTRHQATVSVAPSPGGARVVWAFDVEPDEMAPIFADTYQKALEALAARFA